MGVRRGPRGEAWPGSGPRLEPDTAGYFRRALETLQDGLSPEELALFAPNVLAEAEAAMPGVALDPGGSRLLQALLPRAPLRVLGRFLPPLIEGGLGGPAGHPLGARVLEAALGRVVAALGGGAVGQEEEEEAVGQVEEAVGRLAAEVGGQLVAFARHPAGSFVVRGLLRVLGGVPGAGVPQLPPGGAGPKAKGAEPALKGAELPPSFPPLLGQLAEAFEEHLPSLLSPAGASLCLQVALEVLHRSQSEACARLCRALIGRLAPPGSAPSGESGPGLQEAGRGRLLEAAMTVAGPQPLRELFQWQLKGRLRGVANHRLANHGLQRLLDHAPRDVVGEVLSELGPALAEPLASGHPGVLVALLAACRRHPPLQQEGLRCLFQAFGCWEPPERRRACVGLLAGLRPFVGGDKDEEEAEPEPSLGPVTLHGSLLLQHLLHFGDPGPVLGGLEALPPPALVSLARSPPGSRVWDALLASPTVPPRARRRLLRKLKGHFLSLACHRNGSRVLDAVWSSASAPARAAIAEELASQRQALQSDPHGRGVARNLDLDLFLRRRRAWERLQAAPGRRRHILGPLLED